VESLREVVRKKDSDILQLQQEMAQKRQIVADESETLRARVAELEKLMQVSATFLADDLIGDRTTKNRLKRLHVGKNGHHPRARCQVGRAGTPQRTTSGQ